MSAHTTPTFDRSHVIKDARDGLDMRASIYHHAFSRMTPYNQATFLHLLASSRVLERPQLTHVNGRPC